MKRRMLGQTGMAVFPWCLGGNVFGWTVDERASFAILDAYVNIGGNFIDTADEYVRWGVNAVGGESETIIGQWMKSRRFREAMVVATKVGQPLSSDPLDRGLSRRHIMTGIEASLRRLQTDYVDIYLAHIDDITVGLDETLGVFDEVIRSGKARAIGASNYSARAHVVRYSVLQPRYNLLDRREYEGELEDICRRENLGVFCYFSLAGGFLTGKYRPGRALPATPRAQRIHDEYMSARGFAMLEALDSVAARHVASPAQVALAWLMERPTMTAAIASVTSAAHVQDLASSLDVRLSAQDKAELELAGPDRVY